MKKTLLLTGVLLLPPAAFCQQADEVGSLSIGTPVRGEITTRDRINYNDGSRSLVYGIDLDAGQALSFQTSGALCARLVLLLEGERIAGPNPGECEGSDQSSSARISVLAAEKGRYQLAVSGAGSRAFGPFRLEARELQVHRGTGPLQPGAEIADFLRDGGKTYRFDVRQSGYYTIDMRSGEFDAALELSGNGISANDDDGGDGLNSRLRLPLEPGTYTLRARSINDDASGLFELSISTGALPAGVRLRNSGELATDGNALTGALSGTPREYQLRITQPSRVTIDLSSDDFDTVLELAGNGVSMENDDGASGTNSRIAAVLQPGNYQVRARGLGDSANGLFRLSATRQPFDANAFRNGGPLALGTAIAGMLGNSGPLHYEVTVASAGQLIVDMTSDDFDTVLELHRDGSKIAEDDDSGGNGNARLSARVEPGTYTVLARGFGDSASGVFELRARMADGISGTADLPRASSASRP